MKKQSEACRDVRDYIRPSGSYLWIGSILCAVLAVYFFLLAWRVDVLPWRALPFEESIWVAAFMGCAMLAVVLRPWLASALAIRRVKISPEALADDFKASEAFFDGKMRIGEKYIYVAGEGQLIPTAAVDRLETTKDFKYHTTYIVASGETGSVRGQCYSKAQCEQLDIAGEIRRANAALDRGREDL